MTSQERPSFSPNTMAKLRHRCLQPLVREAEWWWARSWVRWDRGKVERKESREATVWQCYLDPWGTLGESRPKLYVEWKCSPRKHPNSSEEMIYQKNVIAWANVREISSGNCENSWFCVTRCAQIHIGFGPKLYSLIFEFLCFQNFTSIIS